VIIHKWIDMVVNWRTASDGVMTSSFIHWWHCNRNIYTVLLTTHLMLQQVDAVLCDEFRWVWLKQGIQFTNFTRLSSSVCHSSICLSLPNAYHF